MTAVTSNPSSSTVTGIVDETSPLLPPSISTKQLRPSSSSIASKSDEKIDKGIISNNNILDHLSFLKPHSREEPQRQQDDGKKKSCRQQNQLPTPKTSSSPRPSQQHEQQSFSILMEVIGCRNLYFEKDDADDDTHNNNDIKIMHPYCVVHHGSTVLHRTLPFNGRTSGLETSTSRVKRISQAVRKSIRGTVLLSGGGGGGGDDATNDKDRGTLLHQLQNPIWTIQQDSLWLIPIHDLQNEIADEKYKRIQIAVWGRPTTSNKHENGKSIIQPVLIGKIKLTVRELLGLCTEERVEMPLVDELGRQVTQQQPLLSKGRRGEQSLLAFRCRIASPDDIELIKSWQKAGGGSAYRNRHMSIIYNDLWRRAKVINDVDNTEQSGAPKELQQPILVTELPESQVKGAFFTTAYVRGSMKTRRNDNKILVKPYADPKRIWSPPPASTTTTATAAAATTTNMYMTKQQFHEEIKKPSKKWIQATAAAGCPSSSSSSGSSSGTTSASPSSNAIARIYLEILSCHDLPNVDLGETTLGNKTDAFCTCILGDSIVQTDIIDDELSPHWPPWSQRAFVWNLGGGSGAEDNNMSLPHHMIYLAVFGYKRKPHRRHKPIGRVEINWLNLPRNSLLELEYNLYKDSHSTKRRSKGTIRIRLRIDLMNERAAMWSTLKNLLLPTSLSSRPPLYINLRTKKSWAVARFTARGEYDYEDKFQLGVLQGYIDEIMQQYLRRPAYNIVDGVRSIVFWQPHNQFQLQVGRDAVFVFPLYSLLCFVMGILVVENPQFLPGMLFLGLGLLFLVQMDRRNRSLSPWRRCFSFCHYLKVLICGNSVYRNATTIGQEIIHENEGWEEFQAQEKAMEERIKRNEKFFQKKEAVEKELEQLEKANLETKSQHTIHLELLVVLGKVQGIVGNVCRVLRFVDSVITWEDGDLAFFVTIALLMIGSIILFIPWAFLLKWIGRILVVVFLGPQNYLIHVLYIQKQSDDEQKIRLLFRERMFHARRKQEESIKLGAFRRSVFGRYSIAVPSIVWTPHKDYPLPTSTAHFEGQEMNDIPRSKSLPTAIGQMLFGTMIPRPHNAMKENKEYSMQQKCLIETNLDKMEYESSPPKSEVSLSDNMLKRELSIDRDPGFEVTDLFDEEAQYVRDVLKRPPPRQEESLHELGVEVLGNEVTESRRFLPAWRSVHEFPPIDEDDDDDKSTSSSDDDSESEKKTATEPSRKRYDRPQQLADRIKMRLHTHNQSTIELGVEVANEYQTEAAFAQQSWRGASYSNLPPLENEIQTPVDRGSIKSAIGLEITEEFADEAAFADQSWRMSSGDLLPYDEPEVPHDKTQQTCLSPQLARMAASARDNNRPRTNDKQELDSYRAGLTATDQTKDLVINNEDNQKALALISSAPSSPNQEEEGMQSLTLISTVLCSPSCDDIAENTQQLAAPWDLKLDEAAAYLCCMDHDDEDMPRPPVDAQPKQPSSASQDEDHDDVDRSVRFTLSEPLPFRQDNDGNTVEEPLESRCLSLDRTFSVQEGEGDSPDTNCDDPGFEVVPDWI